MNRDARPRACVVTSSGTDDLQGQGDADDAHALVLGHRQQRLVAGDHQIGLGGERGADDHIVIRIGRDWECWGQVSIRECWGSAGVGVLGSSLASCPGCFLALVLGVVEPDGPLGRIGQRHELAQRIEDFSELIARVDAEGIVVHGQRLGLVFEFVQPLGRPAVVVARAGTRTKVCMISTFVAMTGGNATATASSYSYSPQGSLAGLIHNLCRTAQDVSDACARNPAPDIITRTWSNDTSMKMRAARVLKRSLGVCCPTPNAFKCHGCRIRGLITPYSTSTIKLTAMITVADSRMPPCTAG